MNIKKLSPLLVIALTLIFMGSASAISLDTFIDSTACSTSLASPFMGSACAIATFDDIISGGPDDVQNDIYVKSAFVEDARERVNTEQRSQLNQTYGIAMSDAKLEIIKGLNNGLTQAEARQNGTEAVEDLYSTYEMRVIAQRNREALKLNQSIQQIKSTDGLSLGNVFKVEQKAQNSESKVIAGVSGLEIAKNNYTLYNGTTVDLHYPRVKMTTAADNGVSMEGWFNFSGATYDYLKGFEMSATSDSVIWSTNVDGNRTEFINVKSYTTTTEQISGRYQTASTTVTNLSDKVYSNYQSGDVNVSSVCGPLCSLKQASTNYADTGAYSYLAYSLHQMGLASDQATAFELTIDDRNLTATGQLFLETDAWSDTTIEVNKTYDASNKPAWFVYKPDGSPAKKISLNGNFTVNELWDTTNSTQINSTTVQQTDFYTKSTSDLQQQLDELEKTNDISLTIDTGGAGGSTGGSLFGNLFEGINRQLLAVIGILLAVVVGALAS